MQQITIIYIVFFAFVIISFIFSIIFTLYNSLAICYIVFGISLHIIQFMCLLVFLIFQYNLPKRANKFNGYNTKLSLTNQLMWDYAQNYFNFIFAKLSMILIGINLIYLIVSIFANYDICLIWFCILMCVHTLSLLILIIFVKAQIKKVCEMNL